MKRFCKYLLVILVAIAACDDNETPQKSYAPSALFPLRKGQYQVYDVLKVQFAEIGDPDTARYELKTQVIDSFPNSGGSYTYVIHNSKRAHENDAWQFVETWSARSDEHEVVTSEGNVPYVKIRGSSRPGNSWDGNAYNTLGVDEYEMISSPVSVEINGISFADPIVIEQEVNDDPIVFTDLRSEMYVSGVGLVSKETTQLHYCVEASCNNQNVIIDGVVLKQNIKSYGVE